MTDPIVQSVLSKLQERSTRGIAKYNTTLAENPGDFLYWLNHAQEEAMDFVLYLERIKQEIPLGGEIEPRQPLDEEGYPSEESLKYIATYAPSEDTPIIDFLLWLRELWWQPGFGFKLVVNEHMASELTLHTGGWSGNESIVEAMLRNPYLTVISMQFTQWRVGGHYYFKIRNK